METRVSVKELSESGVSRARGNIAFRTLQGYLSSELVELDFSDEDLISLSFLDEMVLRLMESKQLQKVVFFATDPLIQQKLAQVASVRNATIFFRSDKGQPRQVIQPKPTPSISLKSARGSIPGT